MRKSVLILGAGVAGLAAARALSAQDVSVVVLEAQPRLGGRIHTLYENSYLIELGAEFVHGENQNLFETLRAGSLPVKKIERKTRLFENGRMFDVDPWVRTDEILRRIDPAERDGSFECLSA
jgi:protoporphyrinogen oxidase